MRAQVTTTVASLLLTAFSGCGGMSSSALPDDGANPDPRCQPIAANGCFLPFPSSFYLKTDGATETGYRVSIPTGVLPKNQVGKPFDPARWNLLDGFSPATQIVADVGPVDASKLPGQTSDYAGTLDPHSPVQLLDYATGERVAVFAEVDANAPLNPDDRRVLLIHPAVRLKPNTRYVVALVGLSAPDGKAIVIKPFRALADGNVQTGSPLAAVKAQYAEIFALLEKQGVPRAGLTYAWDFRTASDRQATGHLLAMRDAAFKRWESQSLGWTITSSTDTPKDDWIRTIIGTYQVPSFLTDNQSGKAGLKLDDKGNPVDTGTNYDARLIIHVPRCALTATAPLPVLLYGHGLFGSATESNGGVYQATANALCMVMAATDWVGLSDNDVNYVVSSVFANFDTFSIPTDRLQQGQLNFLVLARAAARKWKTMKELMLPDGMGGMKPLVDGSQVYYDGNSQGGIEGNTLLALSPDIDHGVLGVPGGVYSLMLTRSTDFKQFKAIMDYTYPSEYDQEIMLALAQSLWDFTDPVSFVGHTISDPFADDTGKKMAPKHMLMQVSRNDAQVPNISAAVIARTAGIAQLGPPVQTFYGLPVKTAPLDSAFTLWDVHPTPEPGTTNVPPAKDNSAHEAVRRLPLAIEQMKRFLRPGGVVEQTCPNTCDFPPM